MPGWALALIIVGGVLLLLLLVVVLPMLLVTMPIAEKLIAPNGHVASMRLKEVAPMLASIIISICLIAG